MSSDFGQRLKWAAAVLVILLFVRQVLLQSIPFVTGILGRKINRSLKTTLMRSVLAPSDIHHLDSSETADRISQAGGIATGRFTPAEAINSLYSLFSTRLPAFVFCLVVAAFSWWMALSLLILWQFTRHELLRQQRNQVQALFGQPTSLRRSEYVFNLATTPSAAKELRIFGLQSWLVERFRSSWLAAMTDLWKQRKGAAGKLRLAGGLIFIGYVVGFWLVARSALNGEISIGFLVLLVQALVGMIFIGTLGTDEWRVDFGVLSMLPILALEKDLVLAEEKTAEDRLPTVLTSEGPSDHIHFENVSFRYPDAGSDCLSNLDLSIPIGQSLAIVGSNGAGKTTIVKLLCKLYEPTGGRLVVDGIDLAGVSADSWRARVAVVFQDFVQFQLSLRDNVAFGNVDSSNAQALSESARLGSLSTLIDELPQGWDTTLSSAFSGGVDLSGGQWQKTALARAFFAVLTGAKLLVLDEPTAHLDIRAEEEFFSHLIELTQGLTTTVTISHRYSTVRRADRICVLDEGHITEEGTHDDLMAVNGAYAHAFNLQASKYKLSLSGETSAETDAAKESAPTDA